MTVGLGSGQYVYYLRHLQVRAEIFASCESKTPRAATREYYLPSHHTLHLLIATDMMIQSRSGLLHQQIRYFVDDSEIGAWSRCVTW